MVSLENASKNIKTIFLLEFTKQLILNSRKYGEKLNESALREKIKEIVKRKSEEPEQKIYTKQIIQSNFNVPQRRRLSQGPQFLVPRIAPFPATVRDVKPAPIPKEMNLGKVDVLRRDPTVNVIIIDGPDKNVQVRRGDEKRITAISLTLVEIKEIINLFAEESKIPIEDFYKVVVGNLMLSAVNPRGDTPKLIITKLQPTYAPRPRG